MRRLFLYSMVLLIGASACTGSKTGGNATTADSITLKQFTDKKENQYAEVSITADLAVDAGNALADSVNSYINRTLGGEYNGSLADGDKMVAFYSRKQCDSLTAQNKKLMEEFKDSKINRYGYSMSIKKVCETPSFITFSITSYNYTGGAHGSSANYGATFIKDNGAYVGKNIIATKDKAKFNTILKNGLKEYFSSNGETVDTDSKLAECLFLGEKNNMDNLPLPALDPYLTTNGVVFTYSQYEIAPYAAGMPTFTVDFGTIKPYLTEKALELIEKLDK